MTCGSCGFTTTEAEALFCPNCGEPLRESQPITPPVPSGLPSDPIYHTRTRASAGFLEEHAIGSRGDATPPTHLPTNSRLYRADAPAGILAAPPAAPAMRKRKTGFILASILTLLVVFGGGVGVGVILSGARGTPIASGPSPTAPATPAPSPTATPRETVIFQDALSRPTNPWPVDTTHCRFQGGSYHVLKNYICDAPIGVQSDFALSVQVKQVSGPSNLFYGLVFRYASAKNFYLFRITGNSTWLFTKEVNGIETQLVPDTSSKLIQPGLNSVNTLLLRVQGTHFDFFVNGSKVGEASDASFSAGTLGFIGADNADIAFSNIQLAALS